MFCIKKFSAVTAATILSATVALAGDPIPPGDGEFKAYGEVEGWRVIADVDRGSCLIEKADDSGVVQMGLTKDHEFGYLGVFSANETAVKKGAKQEIFIDIDGKLYSADATGMKGNITEGYSGGYLLANNPNFISDLAKKHTMTVFPETSAMFKVDLKGTYKAMEMARKCNTEQPA